MPTTNGSEKFRAIQALDEAIDKQMVDLGNKFTASPSMTLLEQFSKLVEADVYCDKYLATHSADGSMLPEGQHAATMHNPVTPVTAGNTNGITNGLYDLSNPSANTLRPGVPGTPIKPAGAI